MKSFTEYLNESKKEARKHRKAALEVGHKHPDYKKHMAAFHDAMAKDAEKSNMDGGKLADEHRSSAKGYMKEEQLDERRNMSDESKSKLKKRIAKKHDIAWGETIRIRKEKKSVGPADTRDMDKYRNRLGAIYNKLKEDYPGVQRRSNKTLDPDLQQKFKDYKSDQQAKHSSNMVKMSYQNSPNQTFKTMGQAMPWKSTDSRAKYDATRDKIVDTQNQREIRREPPITVKEDYDPNYAELARHAKKFYDDPSRVVASNARKIYKKHNKKATTGMDEETQDTLSGGLRRTDRSDLDLSKAPLNKKGKLSGNTKKWMKAFASPSHSLYSRKLSGPKGHLPEENINEVSYSAKAARAGKDIGKPGKNFEKIADSASKKYGSKEAGKRVAGAILAKLRSK